MNVASTARRMAIGVLIAVGAAACTDAADPSSTVPATLAPPGFTEAGEVPPPPELDDARVATGEALYQQRCAAAS